MASSAPDFLGDLGRGAGFLPGAAPAPELMGEHEFGFYHSGLDKEMLTEPRAVIRAPPTGKRGDPPPESLFPPLYNSTGFAVRQTSVLISALGPVNKFPHLPEPHFLISKIGILSHFHRAVERVCPAQCLAYRKGLLSPPSCRG